MQEQGEEAQSLPGKRVLYRPSTTPRTSACGCSALAPTAVSSPIPCHFQRISVTTLKGARMTEVD